MTILIVSKDEQKGFLYDKKDFKLENYRYIFKNVEYFKVDSIENKLIIYRDDYSITMKYENQIKIQININKEIK